jgi:hypothetical protein
MGVLLGIGESMVYDVLDIGVVCVAGVGASGDYEHTRPLCSEEYVGV